MTDVSIFYNLVKVLYFPMLNEEKDSKAYDCGRLAY